MKKTNRIIFRTAKYLIVFLLSFFLIVYLWLNIYVSKKSMKFDSKDIIQESTVELTDEQIYVVSFLYANGKYKNFKTLPLIIDAFSTRNNVALIMSEMICDNSKSMNEWRFSVLGTKRYIEKKLDYRICCNYICSKIYFGNEIFGLSDASVFYYNKDYKDLSDLEFTKIILSGVNPGFYNILENKKRTEEKALEILLKIR